MRYRTNKRGGVAYVWHQGPAAAHQGWRGHQQGPDLVRHPLFLTTAGDALWLGQRGVLVNAKVVSNREAVSRNKTDHYAVIAYIPVLNGSAPPTEVRVELPDEGAYAEGSEIAIFYDPTDLKHVRRAYFTQGVTVTLAITPLLFHDVL
jgi:hypothetical protein